MVSTHNGNKPMINQFFYTRIEGDKEFTDSFNVNKVIRSIAFNDELVILLDDIHERVEEVRRI